MLLFYILLYFIFWLLYDVDIHIIANSLAEGRATLVRIYKSIKKRYRELGVSFQVARTGNAINMCSLYPIIFLNWLLCYLFYFFFFDTWSYPYRPIQLIITLLRSKEDFLLFCDLDCTSCAYLYFNIYH